MATAQIEHKRVSRLHALAAFSPDALASIGYANQEIYLGLVVAGTAGLAQAVPIGVAITALLAIVGLSYYQTIQSYPLGGGSYSVARENLGTNSGLVAASALILNYVLNVSVSLTAGFEAIASAFPQLRAHRLVVSLSLLLALTALNLRGLRETGFIMAIPVFFFLAAYLPMLGYGGVQVLVSKPPPPPVIPATQIVTMYLLIHTFSMGCTALTGVEAISNGVPSFEPPEHRNAGHTMLIMTLLMGILFMGSIGLTQYLGVVAGPSETILSSLARRLVGNGFAYLTVQAGMLAILAVGANTSFAGFPRLAAVLAGDGFLPQRIGNASRQSVFVQGTLLLSGASAALIVLFGGYTHALIPLFATGVFLAYTLSQIGMVIHWKKEKSAQWRLKALVNGIGAGATAVTLVIVSASKFLEGAWISLLVIPALLIIFIQIRARREESMASAF